MAKTIRVPFDFNGFEIRNYLFHLLSSAPSSPAEGQPYYNLTDHTVEFYNGSAWITWGKLNQISAPGGDVAFNGHKATGLADGGSSGDAATYNQMNTAIAAAISAIASGQHWKDDVRAVSLTNGTLATAFENGDTVGGVVVASGDRILLAGQTAGETNGIKVVQASGAPVRADDSNTAAEVAGTFVGCTEGTSAGKIYYVTTDNITLDTTSLSWSEFTGTTYSGSGAILLTGTTFTLSPAASAGSGGPGGGLTTAGAIDTDVVVRKSVGDIGDGSTTAIVYTHGLGTRDVTVAVYDKTTPFEDFAGGCTIKHTSTTTVTIEFGVAPTTNQFRVVVHG